jgi:ribosomal protein S18 acetylase RimI-like enzyme
MSSIGEHEVSLVPVSKEMLESVLLVYEQCEDFLALGQEPKASLDMVIADMEYAVSEGGALYGVLLGEALIGVASFVNHGYGGNPAHAYLILLMIAMPYRGRGVGERIVSHIEALMASNPSVERIISAVQDNNPRAIAFWQRMGYEISGGPELQPDGTTVLHLAKSVKGRR